MYDSILPYEFTDGFGGKSVIEQMSSHRNGVGGSGFVVCTITRTTDEEGGEGEGTFLTMSFDRTSRYAFATNTGAVLIELLPDIQFANGNSWRGADMFGEAIADAYEKAWKLKYGEDDVPWG